MVPFYQDENGITIYHGDARVIVPALFTERSVDVVITDPPYDSRTHHGARTNSREAKTIASTEHGTPQQVGVINIGFKSLSSVIWPARLRFIAKRWCIIFCSLEQLGAYQEAAGDDYIRGGFYHRHGAPQFSGDRPAQAGEGIAILHRTGPKHWNGGGDSAYWQSSKVPDSERVHPTQKPEPLMSQLVDVFSDQGETILDPFMGSGTTLVVAKRMRRAAIGIEQDANYCEVARDRLAQCALPFSRSHQETQDPLEWPTS